MILCIDLKFINSDVMNEDVRKYGTYNVAHTFSRLVSFPELLNALTPDEIYNFKI